MSALVRVAEVQGASESFAERGDATSLSVLQETWETTMLGISGGDVVGAESCHSHMVFIYVYVMAKKCGFLD